MHHPWPSVAQPLQHASKCKKTSLRVWCKFASLCHAVLLAPPTLLSKAGTILYTYKAWRLSDSFHKSSKPVTKASLSHACVTEKSRLRDCPVGLHVCEGPRITLWKCWFGIQKLLCLLIPVYPLKNKTLTAAHSLLPFSSSWMCHCKLSQMDCSHQPWMHQRKSHCKSLEMFNISLYT